jgi:hypothetical protein
MTKALIHFVKRLIGHIMRRLKRWSKPASVTLVIGMLSNLKRSRKDLVIENIMLRQQLIVFNRYLAVNPANCPA